MVQWNGSQINSKNAKQTLRDCIEMLQLLDYMKRRGGMPLQQFDDAATAFAGLAAKAAEVLVKDPITP